jgi:hypothetical protein
MNIQWFCAQLQICYSVIAANSNSVMLISNYISHILCVQTAQVHTAANRGFFSFSFLFVLRPMCSVCKCVLYCCIVCKCVLYCTVVLCVLFVCKCVLYCCIVCKCVLYCCIVYAVSV